MRISDNRDVGLACQLRTPLLPLNPTANYSCEVAKMLARELMRFRKMLGSFV